MRFRVGVMLTTADGRRLYMHSISFSMNVLHARVHARAAAAAAPDLRRSSLNFPLFAAFFSRPFLTAGTRLRTIYSFFVLFRLLLLGYEGSELGRIHAHLRQLSRVGHLEHLQLPNLFLDGGVALAERTQTNDGIFSHEGVVEVYVGLGHDDEETSVPRNQFLRAFAGGRQHGEEVQDVTAHPVGALQMEQLALSLFASADG
mmetsp:Transcript_3567/g.6915  ORF Transcript_3567/g.6915 Transcript_3567/m.6915 type:complete len:202 (-) Transcript_3567:572-1177(-)